MGIVCLSNGNTLSEHSEMTKKYRQLFKYMESAFLTLFNPLTAGAAYIRVFIFYQHIKYYLLNMLKTKCDIDQQYLKTVDLHFVKSE